ncbi:TniQ family protein [Nocardioides rotundus]|uniref:TniQ family protein n=1 Tax=Nocardioides rotundus TaxID=1774216 RepID=UPI001CC01FD4|nr:TniQ family protein [Nocardioides rotundus]UAL29908.1 TniQ family protein [Nocardioides rotundus]
MPADVRLPVSVAPVAGEALDGYLERLAAANGMDHPRLVNRIRAGGATTAFLTIAPDSRLLDNITTLADLPEPDDTSAHASLPGIDTHDLDPTNKRTWRNVAARGWPPERGTALCPLCLADDGVWRLAWRHPWVTACVRHRVWLLGRCPACGRRFRAHRTPLRPADAPAGLCGNPAGARGRNCPQPLDELDTEPAREAVLDSQRRIDTALAGSAVPILGVLTDPESYLAELKALTVLLLHLAIQPDGDGIAEWAHRARLDRSRSAGGQGARWGLAPPADLMLRGSALAVADAVLRAPALDTAAEALRPWTELTPPTNDGQLGWLADHTTMTPTLARLVMSATAARRRIATLLDHSPTNHCAVTAVPQVLPADLYAARMRGLLDVADRTGRLYASLCLARRHTGARTWAEAAIVLGLPAEIGVKTARACSANVVGRPDRFVSALDELAGQLDVGVDYRAREDVVRRLASRTIWCRRWARAHHRGSHTASAGYAATWLWTEYAHGHIDTSPGWPRPPDHTDRARFRRYASRLSTAATDALSGIAAASAPTRRIA